jgi:hypothetical protein
MPTINNSAVSQPDYFRRFAMMMTGLVFLAASLFAASSAMAGEFFEKNGAAIDGFDTVAYFTANKAMRGDKSISTDFRGSKFYFASAANRALFLANSGKYVPQFNGYCAFGVAQGAKVKIEGERFAVFDGKLYLNYDEDVQQQWNKNVPGFIQQAEKNWPGLK